MDICYGLTETQAAELFEVMENTYDSYYLLAQNQTYVYCISDKKTFKAAGFTSLANDGTQYICD